MATDRVTVNGVELGIEAARVAEAAGVDPALDVRWMRAGWITLKGLLADCLRGADDVTAAAWREYVSDIVRAARVRR